MYVIVGLYVRTYSFLSYGTMYVAICQGKYVHLCLVLYHYTMNNHYYGA